MTDELAIYEQEPSSRPFVIYGNERAIGKMERRTVRAVLVIRSVARIQAAKVDAVSSVGRRALFEAGLLTQSEQSLAMLVPAASGRLAAIADVASLGLTEVVADTIRRVLR